MLCPNCSKEISDEATFCRHCSEKVITLGKRGKRRSIIITIILLIITLNIYWIFWLYYTYKELREFYAKATDITPGQAVGYAFIPFYNIFYWVWKIFADFPKAIKKAQDVAQMKETIDASSVTALLVIGFILNYILSIAAGIPILGIVPMWIGILIAQNNLNKLWESSS